MRKTRENIGELRKCFRLGKEGKRRNRVIKLVLWGTSLAYIAILKQWQWRGHRFELVIAWHLGLQTLPLVFHSLFTAQKKTLDWPKALLHLLNVEMSS